VEQKQAKEIDIVVKWNREIGNNILKKMKAIKIKN
jgi:hypothetical protein